MDDSALINEFNGLNYAELTELASLTPRYHRIIVDNFITPKYHLNQAKVEIGLYHNRTTISYFTSGRYTENSQDLNVILSTLKAFCPLFSHLTVQSHDFPYNLGITQKIVESVNNYCAEVPQSVSIAFPTNLEQIFTFQNVSTVILHEPKHNNVDIINQMFPQMKSLVLYTEEPYSLDGCLPNLQHFQFQEKSIGLFDMKKFGEFNRQIRSIKVTFDWNLNFLHELNEIFPELENLELVPLYNKGILAKMSKFYKSLTSKVVDTIRFRKVSTFTLDIHFLYFRYTNIFKTKYDYEITRADWAKDRLSAIQFDQLKSYKLITKSRNFVEEQIDLVTKNTGLKSVAITPIELTYEQMVRMVRALPKLKEATLECESMENVDNIVRLMGECHLNIVNVNVPVESRDEFLEQFSTRVADGWTFDRENGHLENRLSFIRSQGN